MASERSSQIAIQALSHVLTTTGLPQSKSSTLPVCLLIGFPYRILKSRERTDRETLLSVSPSLLFSN